VSTESTEPQTDEVALLVIALGRGVAIVGAPEGFVFELVDALGNGIRPSSSVQAGSTPPNHVGPGIRYVLSGEVTFTEGGRATIYKAGDYFFETGNLAHTAENKTNLPLHILFFEVLPKNWTGPTVVPPHP
jgi:Cupin domain